MLLNFAVCVEIPTYFTSFAAEILVTICIALAKSIMIEKYFTALLFAEEQHEGQLSAVVFRQLRCVKMILLAFT